jgi:hypothetical protein
VFVSNQTGDAGLLKEAFEHLVVETAIHWTRRAQEFHKTLSPIDQVALPPAIQFVRYADH